MIVITEQADGLVLPVRAQPGARRAGIVGEHAGALKIAVTAPPEDGRANEALVDLLRRSLRLKRSEIQLLSGATSRDKRFLVRALNKSELEARLKALRCG